MVNFVTGNRDSMPPWSAPYGVVLSGSIWFCSSCKPLPRILVGCTVKISFYVQARHCQIRLALHLISSMFSLCDAE